MRVAILRRSVASAALAIAVAATGHPLAAQAAPDVGPAGRPSGPTPGIGEGFVVRAGDLDGRPGDEIVVGSRRVAAFDQRSLTDRRPIWTFQWPNDPDNPYGGADNEWVTDIAMVNVTGDKVPEVLLTNSRGEIYLLDGRNGKPLWQQDAEVGTWSHLAVIDADSDGVTDFFATGGLTARSGRTGQPLWRADAIPRTTHWAVTAELDGKPGRDVLIAYERPGIIPPPGGGGGDDTAGPPEVFAYTGSGELLWSARPVERIFSLAKADANGDGIDEAVVGMDHGQLAIMDQRGERWRTTAGSDPVRSLVTVEAADGGLPTFAATSADASPGFVTVDADGVVTGLVTTASPVHQLTTRKTGSATHVLASTRAETWLTPGSVYAFDLAAGTEPLWRAPTTGQVESITTARVAGEDLVVYGSQDAVVRGVSAAGGKPAFTYLAGGFVQSLAAGNVDGRPGDEIATVDAFGSVAVQRRDGVSVGSYDLLDDAGTGQDVAVADVDGDGIAEVAASGYLFSAEKPGVVTLYGRDGGARWTTRLDGWAQSLALADVDGVPGKEVVVGEVTMVAWLGGPGYVTVLDGRTGKVKWRTEVGFSFQTLVEAADVDGDGRAEIAFSDITVATQPTVALLGGDGKVRWRIAEMPNGGWLTLSEHGVTTGGSRQNQGTVTRYRLTDGAVEWRTTLPGVAGRSGASTFGALVPDVTGDGVPEVAGSSQAGIVRLLDGATGAVRFATALDAPGGHLWAGPITVVRPNPGQAPRLVVGQASSWRSPARIFSLSLDGTVLQSWETTGEAWAAVTVRLPGNKEQAAVAAGLSVYLRGVS